MDFSWHSLIGVALGIGLAAATGFRIFIPLLVAGLAARLDVLPLGDSFQWLQSTPALVMLGTAAIAETRGCRVVRLAARRIAAARNAGGAVATGEIFSFADADMRIHPETFNAIDDMLGSGRIVAGATGVTLERWSLGLAVTYALVVPWVWLLRMDTGVVFCPSADFRAVGGFDERRSFGEDVQFLLDLRRLGRARGQRLGRARRAKAIASTRKFDRYGDWHYFRLLLRLLGPMLRSPATRSALVEDYWYRDPAR